MNVRAFSAMAVFGLASSYAAWAQQPEQSAAAPAPASPAAVWTPSSGAPAGLLTPLEMQRHDAFIERARAGEIDIVFFGTTSTEMWLWGDRGQSVWDRELASRKAAGFGSQGTRFESLLWRMRNGELDGYRAKLVVFQGIGPGDSPIPNDRVAEHAAGYAAVIAEVRARQPQAKILIFGPFPRGRQVPLERWREAVAPNAALLEELADNETIFYVDIGERFFYRDGSFNFEMWGSNGIRTPAFDVWAEELEPWLARFVG